MAIMTKRSIYDHPLTGPSLLALSLVVALLCYKTFDSHDWPDVSGQVLEGQVIEDPVDDHDTGYHAQLYRVSIKYLYIVNDVSYTGEDTVRTFDERLKAEQYLKEQYWKNQNVRVLFNPYIPNLSTLRRAAL